MFTIEPLHNFYPVTSKFVKNCTVNYLFSARLTTEGEQNRRKAFVKIRARVIRGCALFAGAQKRDEELPEPRKDFSKDEA